KEEIRRNTASATAPTTLRESTRVPHTLRRRTNTHRRAANTYLQTDALACRGHLASTWRRTWMCR
ncbi:MAG: hypothetical protein ACK55Z_16105, partial [bacterium]